LIAPEVPTGDQDTQCATVGGRVASPTAAPGRVENWRVHGRWRVSRREHQKAGANA